MLYTKRSLTNRHYVRSTCVQDLETLQDTINSLLHSNISLRDQNADLKDQILVLESNLYTLEGNLNTANATISSLNAQVSTLTTENNKLKNDLIAANTTISSLNSQITTLTNEKNSLTMTLDFLTGCDVQYNSTTKEFVLKLGKISGSFSRFSSNFLVDGDTNYLYTLWLANNAVDFNNVGVNVRLESRNSSAGGMSTIMSTFCSKVSNLSLHTENDNLYLKFPTINTLKDIRVLNTFNPEVQERGADEVRNIIRFLFNYCVR
jgi:hypothetical protein